MHFFDTHTHLNDPKLYIDWEKYLDKFVQVWWRWLVNIGVDFQRNQRWVEIAKKALKLFENVKVLATAGIHPSEVVLGGNKITEDWKWKKFWRNSEEVWKNFEEGNGNHKRLRNITEDYKLLEIIKWVEMLRDFVLENTAYIFGIGECGIDLHYPGAKEKLDLQKHLFGLQCELAQEFGLPLVIHSRDAFKQTFDVVKNFKNLKIYFHCWWYWPDEVKKVLDSFDNVWIWFAWNVTYPKANNLRQSLEIVPLDHLVLETDAPYLAPQKVRWKQNQPAYICYIYEFVAEFRSVDLEKVAKKMEENFGVLWEAASQAI